jgi:hypothetical protein
MKIVHKISAIVLLVLVTLGSAGISFYLHQCGCRETTLFSVETGYNKTSPFCCCSVEPAGSKPLNASPAFDNEDCCKDNYIFFLLPFGPEKDANSHFVVDYKIASLLFNTSIASETELPKAEKDTPLPHSPPGLRAGKELVYFISQIKIPFRTC